MSKMKAFIAASMLSMLMNTPVLALDITKVWSVNPKSEAGAEIKISPKYKLKKYSISVRDDKNGWTEDTENIGWCKFTTKYGEPTDDGGFKIGASLYNESGDRIRTVKIVATVE
jgi:hypothetical protein